MIASKTNTSLILSLGLALVAMPLAIAGNSDKQSQEATFKKMDSNSDGKVTRVEHTAGAKLMFTNMDANKDGKVTAAEMTAAHAKMNVDKAAIADASVKTGTAATPAMKDTTAKTDTHMKTDAHMKGDMPMKTMMSSEEIIKKGDTNQDGHFSAAEHAAFSDERFTKADTNKDGALTLEECVAGGMMTGGMMKH